MTTILTSCDSTAWHQAEKKLFVPGGYYEGNVGDNIDYTVPDVPVSEVEQEGSVYEGLPGSTTILQGSDPSYRSPTATSETELIWIFSGLDPNSQLSSYDWDSNSVTFEFSEHQKVVAPIDLKAPIAMTPTPEEYDELTQCNGDPQEFYGGRHQEGYSLTFESDAPAYGDLCSKTKNYRSYDGVYFRFKFSYLDRFWCCINKTSPDYALSTTSAYYLYAPVEEVKTSKLPQGYVIGAAGHTGSHPINTSSEFCKVEIWYKIGREGVWYPCTFSEFWKDGPQRLVDDLAPANPSGSSGTSNSEDSSSSDNSSSHEDFEANESYIYPD